MAAKTIIRSRVWLILTPDWRTSYDFEIELNWYVPSRSKSKGDECVGTWWFTSPSLGDYGKVARAKHGVVYFTWWDSNGRKKGGKEWTLNFSNKSQEASGHADAFTISGLPHSIPPARTTKGPLYIFDSADLSMRETEHEWFWLGNECVTLVG